MFIVPFLLLALIGMIVGIHSVIVQDYYVSLELTIIWLCFNY